MARPRLHDESLRQRLLERAGRMVADTGVANLSLRALAAEEATSTTAVYSLFGSKSALLADLFEAAFASFGASQRAVPITGETAADLAGLAWAYRNWALSHPHLYAVMFGGALAGFEPDPARMEAADATIQPLSAAVRQGIESGVLGGDPGVVTFGIWAAVHGVVALELAHCGPDDPQLMTANFAAAMAATLRGWAVGAEGSWKASERAMAAAGPR